MHQRNGSELRGEEEVQCRWSSHHLREKNEKKFGIFLNWDWESSWRGIARSEANRRSAFGCAYVFRTSYFLSFADTLDLVCYLPTCDLRALPSIFKLFKFPSLSYYELMRSCICKKKNHIRPQVKLNNTIELKSKFSLTSGFSQFYPKRLWSHKVVSDFNVITQICPPLVKLSNWC